VLGPRSTAPPPVRARRARAAPRWRRRAVLLEDVFDLLFASEEDAFARAEPFVELLADKLHGKRVVFLAGNHDHHIVVRYLRTAVELKIATGTTARAISDVFSMQHESFFQPFLDRRLIGVESEIVYPTYRVATSCSPTGPTSKPICRPRSAIASCALRMVGGGGTTARNAGDRGLRGGDRAADRVAVHVARMPHGTMAQEAFYGPVRRLGRLLDLSTVARHFGRQLVRREDVRRHGRPGVRACDPAVPVAVVSRPGRGPAC
jgi:hypothetical protein